MAERKPTLCIDFDGVIHSYERGWQGGEIYGSLTPGFVAWALEAREVLQLVVYSSRSKEPRLLMAMQEWLAARLLEHFQDDTKAALDLYSAFTFSAVKPAAFLTIDDRAVRFDGDWGAMAPKMLLAFEPWTNRPPQQPAPDGALLAQHMRNALAHSDHMIVLASMDGKGGLVRQVLRPRTADLVALAQSILVEAKDLIDPDADADSLHLLGRLERALEFLPDPHADADT